MVKCICKVCLVEFKAVSNQARFCSANCRKEYYANDLNYKQPEALKIIYRNAGREDLIIN
jgi:hypothetical protein